MVDIYHFFQIYPKVKSPKCIIFTQAVYMAVERFVKLGRSLAAQVRVYALKDIRKYNAHIMNRSIFYALHL